MATLIYTIKAQPDHRLNDTLRGYKQELVEQLNSITEGLSDTWHIVLDAKEENELIDTLMTHVGYQAIVTVDLQFIKEAA